MSSMRGRRAHIRRLRLGEDGLIARLNVSCRNTPIRSSRESRSTTIRASASSPSSRRSVETITSLMLSTASSSRRSMTPVRRGTFSVSTSMR